MSKQEQKEFRKFVKEAENLPEEKKKILQAYIQGMLAMLKTSA